MKIALVILHADPARGGAERYTLDLATALAHRGHHTSLLASTITPTPDHVRPIVLPTSATTKLGQYTRFLDTLDQHLDANPYDVVHAMLPVRHCDLYHPHAGLAAEAVAQGHLKHDNPALRTLSRLANRLNSKRQRFATVERDLLSGANPPAVLCLSNYVKQTVQRHYTLNDDKLLTLFNAVDLTNFDPARDPSAGAELRRRLNIPQNRVVALMIAQDFARKGLRQTLEALALVNDPRLVLLVVGKQDPAEYQRLARELKVEEQVIFAGSTDNPHAFYAASDLFILPTRHDPCSLVVLEALAMGLPVISTVFNGACEIMTDGVHGFVLPDPGDIAAIAQSMQRLLDGGFRDGVARECLQLRPRLSFENHLERLERIYNDVAAAKKELWPNDCPQPTVPGK